jgi:acetate kinase
MELAEGLEHRSGLLGLAGTADMRELLARDDDEAGLALDVYAHHVRAGIGAMVASLGGIDALLFTGGVGEAAPRVREFVCDGLAHVGVAIDAALNDSVEGDVDISATESRAAVLAVRAREDLQIARETRALLA